MCEKPIHLDDDLIVPCRKCDTCLALRKADWVHRAMAEKATMGQALAFRLSYRNNPDGSKPVAAKVFNYRDVQNFLKALREDCFRTYKVRGEIRYLVCGELGEKFGRVHWHMILFTDRPIDCLGAWTNFVGKPIKKIEDEKNIHWSHWPHGHIYVQRPDENGMAYVLKYALKDQFNVVKAKGSKRFVKAENHSASMFRMSKKPPIGWQYVDTLLNDWQGRLVVPATLNIKVPDTKGFWWPRGDMRSYIIERLHHINQLHNAENGNDCAHWAALTQFVALTKIETDIERLKYGEIIEPEPIQIDSEREHREGVFREQKQAAARRAGSARGVVGRCGHIRPCYHCRNFLSDKGEAALGRYWNKWFKNWARNNPPFDARRDKPAETPQKHRERFDDYWANIEVVSPACLNRFEDWNIEAFRLARSLRHSASGQFENLEGKARRPKDL